MSNLLPVDINIGTVRRGRILVQNTRIGPVIFSLGPEAGQAHEDYAKAFDATHERIMKAIADGDMDKFNVNQARIPAGQSGGGEWTSDDDTEDDLDYDVRSNWFATPDIKQKFVDDHLAAAQIAADELNVPVENILGLSALESHWGHHRFASNGYNYFGLHAGAAHNNGSMAASQSKKKVRVSTFASYGDSALSFAESNKSLVSNKCDPTTFMQALQDSGKFGVSDKGVPVPKYVEQSAATIVGLRSYITRRAL